MATPNFFQQAKQAMAECEDYYNLVGALETQTQAYATQAAGSAASAATALANLQAANPVTAMGGTDATLSITKMDGTSATITRCTATKPTSSAMATKWMRRANS